jgi:hypothetical protein
MRFLGEYRSDEKAAEAVTTERQSRYAQLKPMMRASQNVEAAYDAAQTTALNKKHWRWADTYNADQANSPGVRSRLRSRSRYECLEGNSYAKGMVHTLVNDVIGPGPRLQLLTENVDNNSAIEDSFHLWMKRTRLARKLWVGISKRGFRSHWRFWICSTGST